MTGPDRREYTVLHVVNDLDTGGAQTLLEALALRRLPGQRLALCVLQGPGQLSGRLEPLFAPVTHLGLTRSSWSLGQLRSGVDRAVRDVRPDIVHSHLLQADLAVLLSRRRGAATVSTVHTTGMSGADPLRSRVLGRVIGAAARRFDAVVACNDSCLVYTQRMRYAVDHLDVIANGVPLHPVPLPPTGPPTLLHLARWHPMKDHATLFAALRSVRERGHAVRLQCAGSGMTPDNAALTDLLDEHGVAAAVDLLGVRHDVAALLQGAHALVLSSAYGEALPMAGLEALAAGRPVVTTDVGGCRSLAVEPALVVPPGRPVLLADAVAEVVTAAPARWRELSAAARGLAERDYDVSTTVRRYDEVYRRLLDRPAPSTAVRAHATPEEISHAR